MKQKLYFLLFLNLAFYGSFFSQLEKSVSKADTCHFNYSYWNGVADKMKLSGPTRSEFLDGEKKAYLESKNHSHLENRDEELVWEVVESSSRYGQNSANAINCTNIDFESGTLAGWTRKTGRHPAIGTGCCPNPNGAQSIMTTAMGNDPYGGFPVVFPGGNFSVRLGDNGGGAIADRLEQTFVVSAANANFTYRYAVVLNDNGHNPSEQPAFLVTMVDSATGLNIPCTQYTVAASNNLSGYSTSSLTGGSNNVTVIYRPWTSVAMDLTPVIGSTVTIRFTTYDCQFNGHFGYAYIDGLCTNFDTAVNDTTCPNVPITFCAPEGFASYSWNGPGVTNNTNSCVAVSNPGTYSCTTVLVPGCPGPTFMHTLTTLPNPLISFTPAGVTCSNQYSFTSAVSTVSGSISSYLWAFGDGSTSTAANPVHLYALPGLYNVKLRAITNRGCRDSLIIPINIAPLPNLAFFPPSNCINTVFQFANSSTISLGSITGYTWNLGNGASSNLVNPNNSYTANGTYSITLTGISNQGCISTLTQTLGIFPPPVISFSASPLCDVNGTSFSPLTSTAIASGSLVSFFWDFGDGGASTSANPTHIYSSPGTYTINFSALSDHNCPASTSASLLISHSPSVAFATTSVNACTPNFTFTNNSSIAAGTVSYTWNFGGTNTSIATSPSYTFPSIGDYTIKLIGVSNLGCGDTAVSYVSVFPYPVVNFSVPASCENAIFTVSTTAVSGSVTSYNWNFGDPSSGALNTSTLQNPTHFYSTTNNYIITLNILSNLNCPSQTVVPITVFPNPNANFAFSTLNNCSLPYTFVNSSNVSNIGASNIIANSWSFGAAGSSNLATPPIINFPSNGSYPVSLTVTTNHNCTDVMTTTVLVHPLPYLNFTVNPTCENVSAIIPSTSSISPVPSATSSILSYTWNFGDNTFASTQNALPHLYTPSNTYSVTYSAASNMGCVAVLTKTILINPIPVIGFSVTPSTNLCLGNLTTFTSQQSISSGTIFTLNWDFGDGGSAYLPNPSHTYSTSGSFLVSYTATSNNECTTVLTKTVTIHPLPVVSFSANGGCLNTISNFSESCTVATPLSNNITSYLYSFGDGGNVTAQAPSRTYTNHGTYQPTLTVGTNQGCFNSNTITVVIHPLPDIVFGPPGGCENSIIQFTNSSSIALGVITSYTWNFANGFTSNLLNPVSTYPTFGLYTPSLTAISNLGCIKTGVSNLTIHPFPQVTVTPVSNSCKSDSALINTNLFIPAGSIQSYTLSFGDGAFNTYSNVVSSYSVPHVYNAYGTFSLSLNAVSAAGCAKSKDTIIVVYPKPFVNFASSNFCYGDLTVFSNSCTIPLPYNIDRYFWNFNDGSATPTSTLVNPSHTFFGQNNFIVYPVSLTAYDYPESSPGNNGPVTCSLTTVKNITVFPIPNVSFTSNNVCLGRPTIFSNNTSSASPSQNIIGYSWSYFNNGIVNSILPNPTYTFPSAGIQTVQLTALNSYNCSNDTIQTLVVYNNPVASFTTSDVCFGNTALFTNTTPPPLDGADSTNIWTIGATTIGLNQDASYQFAAPGTFSVSLNSISTLGCSSRFTNTITIFPLPNLNISVNESCHLSVSQFVNASTINPGSISAYTWDFGDPSSGAANTSTMVAPGHVYITSGNYVATVTALSDKNCSASTTASVIVHKLPSANFTHPLICATENINFNNISSSLDGAIKSNLWDFNGDNVYDIDNPQPSFAYSTPGSFNVKLFVITEFGCADTITRLVISNPKAKAEFSSDNRTGCPPICINFINQSSLNPPSAFSTTWDFGDGSPNSNLTNPSHCFDSGLYNVGITVVTNVGCVTKFTQPGYVSIYPLPVANFNVYPEEVDEEDPIIEVTGEMGADVEQLRYYINDGSTYTSKNFTHYIKNLKNTKPFVVLVAKNKFGCADTISKVLEVKPSFMIYFPNVFTPNNDGNNDVYMPKGVGILNFAIQIYDRWGHKVFTSNDITDMWDGKVKDNDGSIKEDVYTYKSQVTDVFNKNHNYIGHITLIR
jgi:gliding motility-associated-like protein